VKSVIRRSGRGLTLVEFLIAVVILFTLASISIPGFKVLLRRAQLDAAVRQLTSDLREAQSRATLTGWQYRLLGFDMDSGDEFKNQYRLYGRSSGAVAWPADTAGVFQSATQMAGEWKNVNTLYPGVRLDTSDSTTRFWVIFDSRGAAFQTNSFPVQITHQTGETTCLSVTAAGSVRPVGCP
jgi:type II secretory pathway pseudopilin PulG